MSEKRELDSITPSFDLTDEQIEDLRRVTTDPEYAEMVHKEYLMSVEQQDQRLKQTILSGKNEKGQLLPPYYIGKLKEEYERVTGGKL